MANLFFPQLVSGTIAQYPISKTIAFRNVQNVLSDGTLVMYTDPSASMISWHLSYTGLSSGDLDSLQAHFAACLGPYRAFTFIDPTDNMLTSSASLIGPHWNSSPAIQFTGGVADPAGSVGAFNMTNIGQSTGSLSQSLSVPSNFQYCFSVYAASAEPSTITLSRAGSQSSDSKTVPIGPVWSRVVSSGQFNDPGIGITLAIEVAAGQQVQVFGPQLEAQIECSRYKPTLTRGGVYVNAHWGADEFSAIAEQPDSFFTSFSIESAI